MSRAGEDISLAEADLPYLDLVLFESVVVSLGAVSGILFSPRLPPPATPPGFFLLPSPITSLVWLAVFALVGWIGWRIHRRRGVALAVWSLMLACLVVWRIVMFGFGAVWLGAGALMLAALLALVLVLLMRPPSLVTIWVFVPLVAWTIYRSVGIVLLPLMTRT